MNMEGVSPAGGVPALRLVHPVTESPADSAVQPVERDQPRSRAERADTLSFDSVYVSRLPRMPYTEAQRRLERLRADLVAVSVDRPIHFEQSPVLRSRAVDAYARLTPAAAEVNEAATERVVEG